MKLIVRMLMLFSLCLLLGFKNSSSIMRTKIDKGPIYFRLPNPIDSVLLEFFNHMVAGKQKGIRNVYQHINNYFIVISKRYDCSSKWKDYILISIYVDQTIENRGYNNCTKTNTTSYIVNKSSRKIIVGNKYTIPATYDLDWLYTSYQSQKSFSIDSPGLSYVSGLTVKYKLDSPEQFLLGWKFIDGDSGKLIVPIISPQ